MPELSPLRPAQPLAVPAGALEHVVRRGAQRRRRGLVILSSAVASLVVAGVVVTASATDPAYDSLTPADPPTPSRSVVPGTVTAAVPTPSPLPLVSALPLPDGRTPTPSASPESSRDASVPQRPSQAEERTVAVAEPEIVPVDGVCKQPQPGVGGDWCQYVTVPDEPPTGSTTTITLSACLDADALPADLTFPDGPELRAWTYTQPDDAESDPDDDARYHFRARSQARAAHARQLNPGFCVRWQLPWRVVDASGAPLPECDENVTVAARTEAVELADFPFGQVIVRPGRTDGSSCNPPLVP